MPDGKLEKTQGGRIDFSGKGKPFFWQGGTSTWGLLQQLQTGDDLATVQGRKRGLHRCFRKKGKQAACGPKALEKGPSPCTARLKKGGLTNQLNRRAPESKESLGSDGGTGCTWETAGNCTWLGCWRSERKVPTGGKLANGSLSEMGSATALPAQKSDEGRGA